MSFITALFQKPKVPQITLPPPPTPVRNTAMEAQMAQAGRQQGLLATLFGPQGGTAGGGGRPGTGHSLTGQ